MQNEQRENPALAIGIRLFSSGSDLSDIQHSLEAKNFSPEEIIHAMHHIRMLNYAKRRKRGSVNLVIGAALLVTGCILVVLLQDNSAWSRVALYGPTLAGTVLICWGVIDVIGW